LRRYNKDSVSGWGIDGYSNAGSDDDGSDGLLTSSHLREPPRAPDQDLDEFDQDLDESYMEAVTTPGALLSSSPTSMDGIAAQLYGRLVAARALRRLAAHARRRRLLRHEAGALFRALFRASVQRTLNLLLLLLRVSE